jgi:hypothetical protein
VKVRSTRGGTAPHKTNARQFRHNEIDDNLARKICRDLRLTTRLNITLKGSLLLASIASSLLIGCGNVGAPLPPLIQIPVPVSDLAIQQFGKSAQLTWTLPKLNTDGSTATTVATVEIYRLATDHQQPAPDSKTFAQSAQPWKSIPKQILDTYPQGMKLSFSDTFQEFEAHDVFQRSLHYALRVVNNKKQSAGLSNIVSLSIIPLPVSLRTCV